MSAKYGVPRVTLLVMLCRRERAEASAFTAALDDYRQFLRRHREAAAMREQFETSARTAAEQPGDAETGAARSGSDFSLKEGQTIKITLKNVSGLC